MRDLASIDGKWGAKGGLPIKPSLGWYQLILTVIAGLSGLPYAWSRLNDGLPVAGGCLQLVLVYGPTAVLFLVACFWCNVEYQIKRSVVGLDGACSMLGSLRQARHSPVALAVSCSVLVKLLVVVSTGMVTTEQMTIREQRLQELSTSFTGEIAIGNSSDSTPFRNVFLAQKYGNEYPEDRFVVNGAPILIMWLIIGLLVRIIGLIQLRTSEDFQTPGQSVKAYQDSKCCSTAHSNHVPVEKSTKGVLNHINGPQLSEENFDKGEFYGFVVGWEASRVGLWREIVPFATPVLFIMLLEHSYQFSRHHNGFKDVDGSSTIVWHYVPSFLVVGITTCYEQWAFRVQSHHQLSHVCLASETSEVHQKSSSVSLLHRRYISTAAAITTIITANLILVVASGILVSQHNESGTMISVIQQDTFDFSTNRPSNTGPDAALVNLNKSNVQWTYGDMAFPSFTLSTNDSTLLRDGNSLLTVTLPASRAKSNCRALDSENIDFSHLPSNAGVYVNITASPDCAASPFSLEVPYGYFGLAQMPGDNLSAIPGPKCGRWLISTGYIDAGNIAHSTATVLLCNPSIETVQTEIKFHTPPLQIDRSNPSIIHEETATHTSFFSDSETSPDGCLDEVIHKISKPGRSVNPEYYADELFQLMISETPPVDYVGEENVHRLQTAVQTAFGIRQAQHTDYHFRQALEKEKRPALNATLRGSTKLRVVQDAGSTYVLQGLLGGLLICAIVNKLANRLQLEDDWDEEEGLLHELSGNEDEDAVRADIQRGGSLLA